LHGGIVEQRKAGGFFLFQQGRHDLAPSLSPPAKPDLLDVAHAPVLDKTALDFSGSSVSQAGFNMLVNRLKANRKKTRAWKNPHPCSKTNF
jgi:hypothetical protein